MMFEKLKSKESVQRASDKLYGALAKLRLADIEPVAPPEPYYAIIEGKPYRFTDEDTHVAKCAENPEFSAIVQTIRDDDGETIDGSCIYGQAETMQDLEAQGFEVVDESLAEAEANYHLYHPRGNEQSQLN